MSNQQKIKKNYQGQSHKDQTMVFSHKTNTFQQIPHIYPQIKFKMQHINLNFQNYLLCFQPKLHLSLFSPKKKKKSILFTIQA